MKITLAISLLLVALAINNINALNNPVLKNDLYPIEFEPRVLTDGSYLTEVDHFRPQDDRVIRFPFVQNLEFYQSGGPIFIYINDGTTYTTQWLQTGLMYDIAREVNGALITTDHRYFLANQPTSDASFENLQYLTIEQSLADVAFLITTVKDYLNAPFALCAVWGSGYGGTLALWARQKFPHLIHAAWSSSGIFEPKPYTNEPYVHLSEQIALWGGEECANNVENAFDVMDYLIFTGETALIAETLNLCHEVDPDDDADIAMFFEGMVEFIITYLHLQHYHGLLRFCQDMETPDNDGFNAFANWIENTFLFGEDHCHDFSFDSVTQMLSESEWNTDATNSGRRQWAYMRCTQLGLNKVSTYEETLFTRHIPQDYHFEACNAILGPEFNYTQMYESMEQMEIQYGGLDPGVTHVIITNGELDPWFPLGILEYDEPLSYHINIPFYSRSADLTSINPATESVTLLDAKARIRDLIIEWVGGVQN